MKRAFSSSAGGAGATEPCAWPAFRRTGSPAAFAAVPLPFFFDSQGGPHVGNAGPGERDCLKQGRPAEALELLTPLLEAEDSAVRAPALEAAGLACRCAGAAGGIGASCSDGCLRT